MPEPSLRFTTVSVHGDMRTSQTDYFLGRNTRSESRGCTADCDGDPTVPGTMQYRFGPLRAVIHNRDLHYYFHLDLDAEAYTSERLMEYDVPRSLRPIRPVPVRSEQKFHIHTHTVDTGERREIFGYPARRVLIRTIQNLEGDPDPGETETDGWYIDPPPAWRILYPPNQRAVLLASVNGKIPTPVFHDEGPREAGFPLVVTTTHRSTGRNPDGSVRTHTSVYRREVTEISEEPLDPAVFTPPRYFRRVKRLPGERPIPWRLRLRYGWQRLKLRLPV